MSDDPDAPTSTPPSHQLGPLEPTCGAAEPLTGGYYWFPTPGAAGITWSVVTCRDLGCDSDAGHDADLWPRLMVPLAATWGKDALVLKRRVELSYTGLPRGRVTRPSESFLILHGNDSPIERWAEMVMIAFHLTGYKTRFLFDEHETQISGHPRAIEAVLGVRLIKSQA